MDVQAQNEMLRDAHGAAKAYVASLKPGDVFLGVRPEAERQFPEWEFAQRIFMTVALDELRGVKLTSDWHSNVLVSVTR